MDNYYIFKTDWGAAGIVVNEKGVRCVELPSGDRGRVRRALLKRYPGARPGGLPSRGLAKKAISAIRSYYEGKKVDLDFPVDLAGLTPFQKKVLLGLKKVGYGHVRSYSWLAGRIGAPPAVRAVAGAVARNPIALVIPCHRIIRSDGSLGGFSGPGGVRAKRRMLMLEAGS